MVSTFLSDFKENFWNTGATFDPSASLQNYSSFGRSLNELGTSKAEFLNWVTVDILEWIVLCWEGGHPVCCRMFSNIPDLHLQNSVASPPPVVTIKNVPRHCQMSPGDKIVPSWEPLVKNLATPNVAPKPQLEMQHLSLCPRPLESESVL